MFVLLKESNCYIVFFLPPIGILLVVLNIVHKVHLSLIYVE